MKRILAYLTIPALALGLATNLLANTKPDPTQVKIDNFSFIPQTLTIRAGTKVTWINRDDVPHTIVSVDKQFKSKALDTNDQFSHTFTAPGTYSYFCSVHPHMVAKIVVQ